MGKVIIEPILIKSGAMLQADWLLFAKKETRVWLSVNMLR